MPRVVTYACPDCRQTFDWFYCKSDDADPVYCAKCGSYMGDEPQVVPGVLHIGTAKGKSVDQTYRQMEESSAIRAELTGDPTQKITNMNDGLKSGEVAGRKVQNTVTQYADQSEHQYFGSGQVGEALAYAKQGSHEGSGERGLRAIQGGQLARAPQVSARNDVRGFGAGFGGGGMKR